MWRKTRKLLLIGVFFGSVGGCTESLGPELEALDPEASKIVFAAPELTGKAARFSRSYNARYSGLVEQGVWFGPEARHAKALVQYVKASPGYHLRGETDIADLLDRVPAFSEKALRVEDEKWEVNGLGRIKYRHFGFDDTRCIIFGQLFGSTGGERVGGKIGDQELLGYFCADPGKPLDSDLAKRVLTSIDVKP